MFTGSRQAASTWMGQGWFLKEEKPSLDWESTQFTTELNLLIRFVNSTSPVLGTDGCPVPALRV